MQLLLVIFFSFFGADAEIKSVKPLKFENVKIKSKSRGPASELEFYKNKKYRLKSQNFQIEGFGEEYSSESANSRAADIKN